MGFIITNVRRCNRNLFITNLMALIVLLGCFYFGARYFYNFLAGPFEIDKSTLMSIKDPDERQKYYCKIKGDEVEDSGLSYIEEEYDKYTKKVKKTTVKSDYLFLTVDDRVLVVKVPHGQVQGVEYSGALIDMAPDVESNLMGMAKEMNVSSQEFKKIVLPVVLDTEEFGAFAYITFGLWVIFLIIILMNFVKLVIRSNNPYSHPIFKNIAKYGDINELEKSIDQEFESSEKIVFKTVTITPTWLFIRSLFSMNPVEIASIVWIYKKVTQHRTNFIPTGKTYELIIIMRNRLVYSTKIKEKSIDGVIQYFQERHPWVILGFTSEIQSMWSKNPQEMIAYVDGKRNETSEIK